MAATDNISPQQLANIAKTVNDDHAAGRPVGFSVYSSGPKAGEPVGDAYMVGGAGAPERDVPLPAKADDLARYQSDNRKALSRPNTAMGGWGETEEKLVLDSSNIVERGARGTEADARAMAAALGTARERGERAIGQLGPVKPKDPVTGERESNYERDIPTSRGPGRIHLTGRGEVRPVWEI